MKLLYYPLTLTMQPLKIRTYLLRVWLLIHAGIKINPCYKKGALVTQSSQGYTAMVLTELWQNTPISATENGIYLYIYHKLFNI